MDKENLLLNYQINSEKKLNLQIKEKKILITCPIEISKKLIYMQNQKNQKNEKNYPLKNISNILKKMKNQNSDFFIDYKKIKKILNYYRESIFPFFLFLKNINNFSIRTFLITIFIFLTHFSKNFIDENFLKELICITYVVISTKYEESQIIDIEENLKFLAGKKNFEISNQKILEFKNKIFIFEKIILEEIDYCLKVPFVWDFLRIMNYVNFGDDILLNKFENAFIYHYLKFPEKLFCRKNGMFLSAKEIFLKIVNKNRNN